MKRQLAIILITLSLAAFSWAQGTNEFFDGKKSQEELEIMKGILNTTISLITKDDNQKEIPVWRNPNIHAFYLAGQGAVFIIPISSYPSYSMELSRALDATRKSLNELRNNLGFETLEDGTILMPAPAAPPAPPAPPAPRIEALEDGSLVMPAPPSPTAPPDPPESLVASQENLKARIKKQAAMIEEYKAAADKYREEISKQRDEVRKAQMEMIEEYMAAAEQYREEVSKQRDEMRKAQRDLLELYRERAEKNREEEQKRREKLLQNLGDIKIHLIETLANYGDSLTTVKADEYINLILNTEDPEGGNRQRSDTISAQKSWITDYKAGRLSIEDFKQKVHQYTQ